MDEYAYLNRRPEEENDELAAALLAQAGEMRPELSPGGPSPYRVEEQALMDQLLSGQVYQPPAGSEGYGQLDDGSWVGPDGQPAQAHHRDRAERLAEIGRLMPPGGATRAAGETVLGAGPIRVKGQQSALADALEGVASRRAKR